MPKLDVVNDMEQRAIGGGQFTFSAARIDGLGASEYTLVTIAVDVTGSVYNFADDLRASLISAIDACKRSARADNLLVRVVQFSTDVGGVSEIHGFKELGEVDTNDYPFFNPGGMTPLYDATYSSIGAMLDYGADLMKQDYLANGIVFIITDGYDNASTTGPQMIRDVLEGAQREEKLKSLVSVLIGINVDDYRGVLESFQKDAGINQYIDAGEATKNQLAKLAQFVSQSISSQSQALGPGGPSQNISATI